MADLAKTTKPLSVVAKLCYAFGAVGNEVLWIVFGAYTSIFLVDVAQMPPLFATSIIFGSRVVDILCNVVMGPMIDRTNTRWGKTKPWIVTSALFMTVTNAFIWYVPDVGTGGKLAWYIILYVVMVLAWSGFAIAYRAFVMFLSDDIAERDSAIQYRAIFTIGGTVVGMIMYGQILASFRRSEHDSCDNITYSANNSTNGSVDGVSLEMTRTGYMVSSAAVCGLLLLSLTAVVFGTTERKDISATSGGKRGQNMFKTAKIVLTFRPNVYFLLAFFFVQVPLSIGHGAIALYVQYSLDLEDQIENVILALMVASAAAVPVIGLVVSKVGRKTAYICFELAAVPVFIGFQFVPKGSLVVFPITIGIGVTTLAQMYIPWLMMTDIIEDCYLQTGERLDTPFVAIFLSINSLAITVGLIMGTIGLEIGGYKLGSCVQPDTVGSALRILSSICTSVLTFIGVVFAWRYPITEDRRKEITEAINKRKLSRNSQPDEIQRNGSLSNMNGKGLLTEETSRPEGLQEEDKLLSSELDLSVLLDCRESVV
ncbi:sodium-dependent lysophosphatidylcholine symporter 1-B-like isoform X2 [Branchiostoma floridae]|uniref:Sodium-dependent lysophosphatidylcholine symporter 1-B-like isoform X2 n=1 Tax=Branchiostoma floridae TaxID=7739 RepID=A0A9J7HSI2_BRAFL|nr:sodium-dependent lysophosphatidylcholine symporter 1-B-like isoform X2 [Branchiostoma floridae]